ncbi:response regulator transcription factor [Streptomyces sp. NPDC101062]|uniref:response regulator transcription factor n=1 Tax=unclassified Streptomyces TaxID=2593676 RepID=UPI002E76C421|nr:response regulator transcription factor [Streptomyces sp. JV176]MEE1800465.1 response regulator transcription factor [Streptomyces sp. JV176]
MQSSLNEKLSPRRGDGQHVLVVADDPGINELLTTTLELAGYRVGMAGTGAEGMMRISQHRFDLVVWDATLPDLAAFARGRRVVPADRPPLLFLAACDALPRLAPELSPGAEDYVTKPVRIAEVLARAQALLGARRPGPGPAGRPAGPPCYGDLVLDDTTCRARRGPRPLGLTPAEYRLLHHLMANAERVLSKEQISRHVWGEFRAGQAIEKLVSRLRQKVDQEEPALVHTHRGFGYWLGCPSH